MFDTGIQNKTEREHDFLLSNNGENYDGTPSHFNLVVEQMQQKIQASFVPKPLPASPTVVELDANRLFHRSNSLITITYTSNYAIDVRKAVELTSTVTVMPYEDLKHVYLHVAFSGNVKTGVKELDMFRKGHPADAKPHTVGNRDLHEDTDVINGQLIRVVDGIDSSGQPLPVPNDIEMQTLTALGFRNISTPICSIEDGFANQIHNENGGGGGTGGSGTNGCCLQISVFSSENGRVFLEGGVNLNSKEKENGKANGPKQIRKVSTPQIKRTKKNKKRTKKKKTSKKEYNTTSK